ncbi:MAG: hypothetical protein IKQ18_01585 [Clostridia bacterium]|jgi:hypothetical protein|nr:hypothetical protein [Clostridia bacterium]
MPENDRAEIEIAEFTELYPDTELDSIPITVWEKVKAGTKLSDAYSEYEKNRKRRYDDAEKKNTENAEQSSGRISGAPKKAIFTAKEVAAMSKNEVAANYDDILYSMKSKGFYN